MTVWRPIIRSYRLSKEEAAREARVSVEEAEVERQALKRAAREAQEKAGQEAKCFAEKKGGKLAELTERERAAEQESCW